MQDVSAAIYTYAERVIWMRSGLFQDANWFRLFFYFPRHQNSNIPYDKMDVMLRYLSHSSPNSMLSIERWLR
jgi:nitroreductase